MTRKPPPGSPIVIKKYGNRRLYDTSKSRYITLEDLAATVRGGEIVKVLEASSGRDLTRAVLLQVLLEQQEALDLVPVELLHVLLRVQGTLEQVPFAALLSGLTRQFASGGQQIAAQVLGLFPGLGVGDVPHGGFGGFGGFGASGGGDPAPNQAEPSSAGPEVGDPPSEGSSGDATEGEPRARTPEGGEASETSTGAPASDLATVRARMEALLGKMQKK